MSREPHPGEVAQDFPHMAGHGVDGVHNDQGELVGVEDYEQGESIQFGHESEQDQASEP